MWFTLSDNSCSVYLISQSTGSYFWPLCSPLRHSQACRLSTVGDSSPFISVVDRWAIKTSTIDWSIIVVDRSFTVCLQYLFSSSSLTHPPPACPLTTTAVWVFNYGASSCFVLALCRWQITIMGKKSVDKVHRVQASAKPPTSTSYFALLVSVSA